ncbi:MAG: dihydroorotate dehydrogenase electron transfer subunit [Armatimonadetes bacterium]|nr:dihydroorotate dehydrogenase electron transfer subunit [Armatimonadota bacterium]
MVPLHGPQQRSLNPHPSTSFLCPLLTNEELAAGFYQMTLSVPADFPPPLPGQFVQVRCSRDNDPFLRRPFSVCTYSRGDSALSIVYQVVGRGSAYLSRRQAGEEIDMLGPLGNPFPLPDAAHAILVGGGVGVPPLVRLADWLLYEVRVPLESVVVLQGARTKSAVLCDDLFHSMGVSLQVSTEDGTSGHKGLVTDLLQPVLGNRGDGKRMVVYACGPPPMLKAVAAVAERGDVQCHVCMEAPMPCGFGVCMGCVIPTVNGYQRCCREGPVFDAREVRWE